MIVVCPVCKRILGTTASEQPGVTHVFCKKHMREERKRWKKALCTKSGSLKS